MVNHYILAEFAGNCVRREDIDVDEDAQNIENDDLSVRDIDENGQNIEHDDFSDDEDIDEKVNGDQANVFLRY